MAVERRNAALKHTHTAADISDFTAAVQAIGDARYGRLAAANTWTVTNTFTSVVQHESDYSPRWYRSASASNEKLWCIANNGSSRWELVAVNDAFTDGRNALKFERSGYAITALTYGNSTDMPTHSHYGYTGVTAASNGYAIGTGTTSSGWSGITMTVNGTSRFGLLVDYSGANIFSLFSNYHGVPVVEYDAPNVKFKQYFTGTALLEEIGTRNLTYTGFYSDSTLTNANRGMLIYHGGNAGLTLTLGALDDGAIVWVANYDSNSFTLAPGSGTLYWETGATLTTGNRTIAYGATVVCKRIGGNWFMTPLNGGVT